MDILTQGLLGSALAQSAANKEEVRSAAVVGFFSGLLADADALIRSASDPLLVIEYHRHFTHSIFFIPVGALLAAVILFPLLRKRLSFGRLYVFALLGYCLSGFLDVCTSYGTYWLWPLLDKRLSLNIISIFDPLFSLVLFVSVLLCWMTLRVMLVRVGLVVVTCYLFIGFVQHERALSVIELFASEKSHDYSRVVVKPTMGNVLLWRTIYESGDRFYINAVRVGISTKVYEGESVSKFMPEKYLANLDATTVLYRDIQRFSEFSGGYVALSPDDASILGDVRYAMFPTSVLPLWGITINPDRADHHASYLTFRVMSPADRQRFMDMLLGR